MAPPLYVKVHRVDRIARQKGFRRNTVYPVAGVDPAANPRRGPLLIVMDRKGVREGFYPDQYRRK